MFHEPLTLNIFNEKHIFATYARTKLSTFYESFNTLPKITTKHEAHNRVDSTVSVNQKAGYSKIYQESTREMGRTVLIHYDYIVNTVR